MISSTESLAFSMHANPGVYAVLVGSGVSRAARTPTGWEITLDLVRRIARIRNETCDPDPERWYRNTLGKEADYSDLLDSLCRTAAERQQLLVVSDSPVRYQPVAQASAQAALPAGVRNDKLQKTLQLLVQTGFLTGPKGSGNGWQSERNAVRAFPPIAHELDGHARAPSPHRELARPGDSRFVWLRCDAQQLASYGQRG